MRPKNNHYAEGYSSSKAGLMLISANGTITPFQNWTSSDVVLNATWSID